MAPTSADVIVIGAGAAGLTAARELALAGCSCILLEARDRIGGRIHTVRDSNWPLPLEAGAEFIHGKAADTQTAVDALNLSTAEMPGEFWISHGGRAKIASGDGWELIGSRLCQYRGPDLPFARFLRERCADLSVESRQEGVAYVEGFDAADAEVVSSLWLAGSEQEVGVEQGARRIIGGYDQILNYFTQPLAARGEIRLGRNVKTIRWRTGNVEVEAKVGKEGETPRVETYFAKAAIVTLPLGVLQAQPEEAAAVAFVPELPAKQAIIRELKMGSVLKMFLLFRRAFWKEFGAPNLAFLQTPASPWLAWWTPLPSEAAMFVGWSAGPRAEALARLSAEAMLDEGVATLAQSFQMTKEAVFQQLLRWKIVDWGRDPFARGAYSYLPAGGQHLPGELGASVGKTLFFAGEATEARLAGTVGGAIASGIRAAREAIEELSRSS